jgi:hypothetical protein
MWKPEEFEKLSREAGELGLALTGLDHESGDPNNGIRLFVFAPGYYGDHNRGDHIGHCRTVGEVETFLQGYRQGMCSTVTKAPSQVNGPQ